MQIPGYSQLVRAYKELSPLELVIFVVLFIILVASTIGLAGNLQSELSESSPARGGSYSEGIVGFPQYINPVLARTDADRDTAALVYAGLTKLTADGGIELDLAESMEVSPDGDSYTFTLRDDTYFHDGHPVTAEDVVYTINMIQDQRINSPQAADWSGVLVRVVDEKKVVFELPQAFQSFPYNARLGILPKHLWDTESTASFPFASLNTSPVGSGPYEVSDVTRNSEGIPTRYTLSASSHFHNTPYIQRINLTFLPDTETLQSAFSNGEVEGVHGSNPTEISNLELENKQIIQQPLNRVFAIYFNQNNNEQLVDSDVRQALDTAVPKADIVAAVLNNYGSLIDGPLPPNKMVTTTNNGTSSSRQADAAELLSAAGWVLEDGRRINDDGEALSLSLVTADITELEETAEIIRDSWEALGISVELTTLPSGDLSRDVIRPREYEALLFGQSINQNHDLYPFWHSSAQDDPGLNLAMYANTRTDEALSDWRSTSSSSERADLKQTILENIISDQPAIFLYTPAFVYLLPTQIQNVSVPPITTPADRFAQIEDWFIRTNELWSVFSTDEVNNSTEEATSTATATTTDTGTSTQDE